MKTFVMRISVAALALGLAAGIAAADDFATVKKKKLGFFESLFSSNGDRPRRPTLFGRKEPDSTVRIIYGTGQPDQGKKPSKSLMASGGADLGDGDQGYGMGNLTYVPDKLVSLGGGKLTGDRPADPAAAAVYDALSNADLDLRVRPEVKQAIIAAYQAQGFKPLWTDKDALTPRAEAMLKLLQAADEDGLKPAAYVPEAGLDPAVRDLALTAGAVNYAHDISGGQFDPRRLSKYYDITPEWVKPETALKVLAYSPYPDAYLKSLEPKHPAYAVLKKALADVRKEMAGKTFAPIATGPRVKPGATDDRLPAVRDRLEELGSPVAEAADEYVLDADLSKALKAFQKTSKLKATGGLDDATVKALNSHSGQRDLDRLVINLERIRWLPKDMGSRNVFVNQAAFEVTVRDQGKQIWQSRVIVGKPMTQTVVFNNDIQLVVFNPSWGIPQSIITNEYLPKLRRDPSYLDRIGFKVTNAKGQQIASSDVNWAAYSSRQPLNVQQPPGAKNSLGELKFLFPNSHNIYMHDTPNRELFDADSRAFSHGCVRVQNPRDFASVLLGWNREKVDANTDSRESHTVKLPKKVPIYITYFTAWPDDSGAVHYYGDIYGRDDTMLKALNATTVAQR
ncbi:L,D-transpeptidase family protein [Aestuariivirga sp.]|uniref:L,D-transpeptidase family protein n=1 Tax=Aestuariivirga sp. TaxID=2650926 RepID=UPI0039E318E3